MKTISVQLFRTPALVNWRKIAITLIDCKRLNRLPACHGLQ
jgi:hypothetical protein